MGPQIFLIIPALIILILVYWIVNLRRVVPTNMVHIIQRARKTISYGKDQEAGNVYYEWPSWLPVLGISKRELPVSNFDLDLENYEAYDKDRLPFILDIKAFFRIANTNEAANKVSSFEQLLQHLKGIVQGAVRSILANAPLEEIMSERSIYGKKFTDAVEVQLKEWGIIPVKNIELMDIRDTKDSNVINNIMAKKKSDIEKQSRIEVALNKQKAQEAEIVAQREVELKKQEAEESIGKRKAEVARTVGIMQERTQQEINDEARVTRVKEMEVKQVSEVRAAEIEKNAQLVNAERDKGVTILNAEADLEQRKRQAEVIKVTAEAQLDAKKKQAEGIKVEGDAKAEAEKQLQLASVTAQVTLAEKVGENKDYQSYLIGIKQVEAMRDVGVEQAKNLGNADIKIMVQGSDVSEGITSVGNAFTSKGGFQVGKMLESLANTEMGKGLLNRFTKPAQPEDKQ